MVGFATVYIYGNNRIPPWLPFGLAGWIQTQRSRDISQEVWERRVFRGFALDLLIGAIVFFGASL